MYNTNKLNPLIIKKMKKKVTFVEPEIKTGVMCNVTKVWVKKGKTSGIPVGNRQITLARKPKIGNELWGAYTSEHPSGDPKEVRFRASSKILSITKVPRIGLTIETETSILLLQITN